MAQLQIYFQEFCLEWGWGEDQGEQTDMFQGYKI